MIETKEIKLHFSNCGDVRRRAFFGKAAAIAFHKIHTVQITHYASKNLMNMKNFAIKM